MPLLLHRRQTSQDQALLAGEHKALLGGLLVVLAFGMIIGTTLVSLAVSY